VLPKWWLGEYWDPQGPFTQEIAGRRSLVGDGRVHASPNMPRVMLPPVCGPRDAGNNSCNGWLNRTFEEPAKPYIRAAVANLSALDAAGTKMFARWWLKTLLLMSHPQAQRRFWRKNPRSWPTFPRDLLPTLRTAGRFPPDLSLWMTLHSDRAGSGRLAARQRITPPATFAADATVQQPRYTDWAMLLPNGTFLAFQLVYHPQCDFTHPFEAASLATRLWPDAPSSLDLAMHPVLGAAGWRQWRDLFFTGGFPTLEYDSRGDVVIRFGERVQCPVAPIA